MGFDCRLVKSDLPFKSRKPIQQALSILWRKVVHAPGDTRSKNARRGDFARAFKASLDDNIGAHWHVLVGESVGFACKKRDRSMGLFRVVDGSESLNVIIYQSPGLEEDLPSSGLAVADAPENKCTVKIVQPPSTEKDSELASIVAVVKSESSAWGDENTQGLAVGLRKRLTEEFGTIWHVVAGQDFVFEVAQDKRNFVVATVGKARVVCFQHEQFVGGTLFDYDKLVSSLPYLFLMLMCFGFMTLNSVCKDENVAGLTGVKATIRDAFCHTDWESYLQYVGGAAVVTLLYNKYRKRSKANQKVTDFKVDAGAAKKNA